LSYIEHCNLQNRNGMTLGSRYLTESRRLHISFHGCHASKAVSGGCSKHPAEVIVMEILLNNEMSGNPKQNLSGRS
jgi:hypothetical protein